MFSLLHVQSADLAGDTAEDAAVPGGGQVNSVPVTMPALAPHLMVFAGAELAAQVAEHPYVRVPARHRRVVPSSIPTYIHTHVFSSLDKTDIIIRIRSMQNKNY